MSVQMRLTGAASVVVVVLALGCIQQSDNGLTPSGPSGLLERIESDNAINAGYGVYPPYTMEDPNTGEVSGLSVQLIEAIGAELGVPVQWHRLNWNTMAADLKRGQFDVIADPIFITIPRAREFTFTAPYAFFADGIAVVREGDERFRDFQDLDKSDIVVAVGQGWASETLVKNRFESAEIRSVQTTTDLLQVFSEVLSGRADVAIVDGENALRYEAEHPDEIDVLFLDEPPYMIPAGFALRPGDLAGAAFLNDALLHLESVGLLDALAKEYNVDVSVN